MSGGLATPDPVQASQTGADYEILQAAAEWFVVLGTDQPTAAEHDAWTAWLAASPRHRDAWSKIEAVNREFGLLPGEPARAALATGKWQRRDLAKKLLGLALVVAVGGGLLLRRDSRNYIAGLHPDHGTATGEIRSVRLDDGALLWLNTASAVDLDYRAGLRRIVLRHGELLLQSAPDHQRPPRPLVVDVGHGRLRALGTRFSVRIGEQRTQLAVFEGAVRVEPQDSARQTVVAAGYQLSFDAHGAGAATRCDDSVTAWTEKRLVADNMRLDDFLAELARYRRGHLACAPAVGQLKLFGSYPLDDPEHVLATLEATLPVRVHHLLPWWTTVEAR